MDLDLLSNNFLMNRRHLHMIITIDGPTAVEKQPLHACWHINLITIIYLPVFSFRGLAYILVHEYRYQEENIMQPRKQDIEDACDELKYTYENNAEKLFIHGKDITHLLRENKISNYASMLGTNGSVRQYLAQLQHKIADDHDLIAEGRDTGSAIFPHAHLKFFLTASLDVRAERWAKDQRLKGRELSIDQAKEEVENRDERDMNRAVAPLCVPKGAFIIDDSSLNQEQVLHMMYQEIAKIKGGI